MDNKFKTEKSYSNKILKPTRHYIWNYYPIYENFKIPQFLHWYLFINQYYFTCNRLPIGTFFCVCERGMAKTMRKYIYHINILNVNNS